MIKVIMGLKGSGKTKKLIDSINETVKQASGDVVCIEYGKKLTYDVNYRVRLVDSEEYAISNSDMLKGFLSGLHAGNFDITNIYIDNLYKTIGSDRANGEEFVAWCAKFAATNNMNITITISDDVALASEEVKQYL
ncbi:MAG: hypothetical protein E7455_07815 [Ruminococcaceae bacterium]|jgi:hypothetical protein|nr:hypothetical protein [Oscillospiraceae bacterium]